MQNYTFLPKDASILGKMFESEEDKKKKTPLVWLVTKGGQYSYCSVQLILCEKHLLISTFLY